MEETVLAEAERLINGDRKDTYGGHSFREISELWTTYLRRRGFAGEGISEADVCIMMALLKVARLAANPTHRDSQVDAAGYIGLIEKVSK